MDPKELIKPITLTYTQPKCNATDSLISYLALAIHPSTGHAEPTVFIHVNRVRSGRFDLWVRVNLSRPELARIISLVSLLLLGLVPAYIITSTSKGLVDALI